MLHINGSADVSGCGRTSSSSVSGLVRSIHSVDADVSGFRCPTNYVLQSPVMCITADDTFITLWLMSLLICRCPYLSVSVYQSLSLSVYTCI